MYSDANASEMSFLAALIGPICAYTEYTISAPKLSKITRKQNRSNRDDALTVLETYRYKTSDNDTSNGTSH